MSRVLQSFQFAACSLSTTSLPAHERSWAPKGLPFGPIFMHREFVPPWARSVRSCERPQATGEASPGHGLRTCFRCSLQTPAQPSKLFVIVTLAMKIRGVSTRPRAGNANRNGGKDWPGKHTWRSASSRWRLASASSRCLLCDHCPAGSCMSKFLLTGFLQVELR